MKKAAGACFAILFIASSTQGYSEGYGMAGCGLGSVIWGKNSQISAATTNGSSASANFSFSVRIERNWELRTELEK